METPRIDEDMGEILGIGIATFGVLVSSLFLPTVIASLACAIAWSLTDPSETAIAVLMFVIVVTLFPYYFDRICLAPRLPPKRVRLVLLIVPFMRICWPVSFTVLITHFVAECMCPKGSLGVPIVATTVGMTLGLRIGTYLHDVECACQVMPELDWLYHTLWPKLITTRYLFPNPPRPESEAMVRPDGAVCVICMTNPRTVACVPCGHVAACLSCAFKLRSMRCSTCNAVVSRLLQLYYP